MKKSFINAVAVGTSLMTIAITPVAVIETFTSSTTVHADSEQSIKKYIKVNYNEQGQVIIEPGVYQADSGGFTLITGEEFDKDQEYTIIEPEKNQFRSVPSVWKQGRVYYDNRQGCTIIERYPIKKHRNGRYYKYIWQNKVYNYGYSSYKGIVVEWMVGEY